jgi:hypothetical protein
LKVVFDENLSPRLARAFQKLFEGECEVITIRDRFNKKTSDITWISDLSSEGKWVVISGDRRITRNQAEYNAFRSSKLVGFFMSKSVYKSSVTKQAARLLILWEDIQTLSDKVEGGALFELPGKAKIRQLKI